MTRRRLNVWLVAIVAYAVFHSALYAFSNPPFESPDEPGHVAYVSHVAQTGTWPDQRGSRAVEMGHHHPLPYFLLAGGLRVLGQDRIVPRLVESPDPIPWRFRHPATTVDDEGQRRAFYALRLVGGLLAGVAVLFTGLTGRLFLPGCWSLAPPFLVATLPQFAYVCGSVSNDPWAAAAGSMASFGAARFLARRRVRIGAVGAFLAVWCKKSGIVFLLTPLVVALIRKRGFWKKGVVAFAIASSAIVPIFIRNLVLYGDWLGSAMEAHTYSELVDRKPLASRYFFTSFPYWTLRSWFAHFGWMSVPVSLRWIVPLALPWLAGAAGLLLTRLKPRMRRHVALHGFLVVSAFAGLVYYNLTFTQPQGRLLFPVIASAAVLASVGLFRLAKGRSSPWAAVAAVVALVALDAACFMTLIQVKGA